MPEYEDLLRIKPLPLLAKKSGFYITGFNDETRQARVLGALGAAAMLQAILQVILQGAGPIGYYAKVL